MSLKFHKDGFVFPITRQSFSVAIAIPQVFGGPLVVFCVLAACWLAHGPNFSRDPGSLVPSRSPARYHFSSWETPKKPYLPVFRGMKLQKTWCYGGIFFIRGICTKPTFLISKWGGDVQFQAVRATKLGARLLHEGRVDESGKPGRSSHVRDH